MEMTFMIFMIIISFILLYIGLKPLFGPKPDEMMIPLSPEQKKSDMSMVYEAIDEAINKSLSIYVSKDIQFSENSKVKMFVSGHYRDLISYLLRPDVTFDDNGSVTPFLNYFVNRVYMIYISETSEFVKSLMFKYYSGFSTDTYFTRTKKDKPSPLFFVSEYVKNDLLKRFNENEIAQAEFYNRMQNNKESADKMTEWLSEYDMKHICKLSLNIYNVYEKREKDFSSNREVKNELSAKHNEQSK